MKNSDITLINKGSKKIKHRKEITTMKKTVLTLVCLIILASYAGVAQPATDTGPSTPYPKLCYDFQDHGDTLETATTVLQRSYTDGFLCPGDVDWFQVHYNCNPLWPNRLNVYTLGTTDTVGYLYGARIMFSNGSFYTVLELIASDDNSFDGINFFIGESIMCGFPVYTSWYYIKVKHKSAHEKGSYRLILR